MNQATQPSVLIIDDEPDIRQLLSLTVERMGYKAHAVENIASATLAFEKKTFQLCLSDLKLPDGNGLDMVKMVQKEYSQTPIIVITAYGSMDIAVEAMKYGAFDFINKPVDLAKLRILIDNALNTNQQIQQKQSLAEIVGKSPSILSLKDKIIKVSRSQAPVFINGESGSGKELVARAIHRLSSRNEQNFIAVNCGAIPKELMESEFFGHIKGSFSGATHNKEGLFQAADKGTLFLDEVADLPLDMQVKLLRAIQEKMIRPVGSHQEIPIDVRILSATHKDLAQQVQQNDFRNDLYYRINVIDLPVPPLRERNEDIPQLIQLILQRIAFKNHYSSLTISEDATLDLQQYRFPGNVRELENILERASALCENLRIESADLFLNDNKPYSAESIDVAPIAATATEVVVDSQATPQPLSIDFNPQEHSIDDYIEGIEKQIILDTLEKNRWNRTNTAKVLGITFRSLRYRLKKLGIDSDE